jgi:TP901 family phage tail tape measure protein
MADNLTTATIDVRANTRGLEKDILKALRTVEFSEINTKKSSQALGRITGKVSEFNKSLEASNARVIAFGASAGAIFAVEKAFSSLITSTIDVEKKLADINVLLNASSSTIQKFGDSLFGIAKNTAQSFSSVADAATELARQGLGIEETLKRTNAALILTRLSGLDAKSSVEALTATLNSFSGSALDAVEVVNKLANVDAAFAVSSADLANAISRVGSTAVDAGVSLDELIALVTSAQQTTARGGAVIGNSFKTIFTRLQRGKVQELLGSLGVDTSEGQSAVSLLQQLATTYDTLGAAQKSYIAEQVGGVFQINILKAALSDLGKEYSIYGRALDTSLTSTDQAIRRNELLNQTVSALSSQAYANLEQAASKIGTLVFEPNAKGFLSGFNDLLSSFNNIDAESAGGKLMAGFFKGVGDFIGGPGAVLATAVLVKLFSRLTQFAAGSAKELLGTNKAAQQQAAIEQSILSILQKNSQFTSQILSGKMTTVQAEKELLNYLTAQSNILREQERLSKTIGANLRMAGVSVGASGIPMVAAAGKGKKAAASGYVPNFAADQAIGQAMENAGARQHGYKAGKAKKTTIHDGNGKSFKSFVNSKEDVKTFTNSAGKKATVVRPPNGFGENTQYAAGGFVPNFAKEKYNIAGGLVNTSQASNVADRGIDKHNSFSYEIVRVGNAKAFDREFNRHITNISSGDQDARDYFKRNGVPSKQIEQLEKNAKTAMVGGAPSKKDVKSLVDNREVNFDKQISSLRNNVIGKSRYEKYAASRTGLNRSSKSNDRLDLVDSEGKPAAEVKFGEISKDNLLSKAIEATASQDAELKEQGRKNYIGKGAENIDIKPGLKLVVPNDSEISKKALGSSSGFIPNFASSSQSWRANPQKGVAGEGKTSISLKEREKAGKLKEVSHASQEDKFAPFDFKAKLPNNEELLIDSKNFQKFGKAKYEEEVTKKLWNYNQFKDSQKQTLDYTKTPVEIYIPKGTYERSKSLKGLKRNKISTKGLDSLKGSGIKNYEANDTLKFKSSIKTFAGGFIPNFASAKASDKMTEMVMDKFYAINDPAQFKKEYDIQSFKPAALKALYRERVGGGDSTLDGRAGFANQKATSGGDVPVKDLGKLEDYTMIHAGAEGYSKKIADYTKEDKKTGQKTRYLASIGTAGLNGKQLRAGSIQDRVGDALVTEANNLSETFNPGGGSKFSNYKQLSNTGSVFSAAGTVFESAVRGAFNVPAQGQGDRIDFPNPSERLRSFFHGATGSYEAKITDTPQHRSSSLSKYVAVKGLSSGFVPNFAYKLKKYGSSDDEVREIRDEKTGSFLNYAEGSANRGYPYLDMVGINSKQKGQGLELFNRFAKIAKRSGRKIRSSTIVPQIERLDSIDSNSTLEKVLKTAFPQLLYRERSNVKNSELDFQYSPYSGKSIDKTISGRGAFSLVLNELKAIGVNGKSLKENILSRRVFVSSVEDSFASGFVPNFAKSKLSFSQTKEDEFGISSLNAIMGGKKVGRFETSTRKDGIIDIGDMTVDKANRGKGIGTQLYKEAIKRNAGKKMKGQLLPQMNRLLEKIKKGEPVSAETLYPQIKRADLAKSSVFEVYGHKGLEAEKMTRDQFTSFVNAKITELKKDPKRLQSYFGNVEADEYGGLGVDLQTQHSSGFVPNFLDVTKGSLPFGVRGRMNYGSSSSKPNIQLGTGAEESTLAHELFHGAYSKSTNKKAVSNPLIGKFISSPGKYAGGGGVISDTLFKGVNRKNLYSNLGLNPVQIDFDGKNAGSTYSGGKAIDEIVTRIQEKVFKNKGNLDSLSADEKNFVKNLEQQGLISNKRLSNISRRSQEGSKFRSLVENKFSSVMGNQAYSGFVPNFASGIITGDVIRGNEYKSVLDFLAKTNKPVRTIIGPSGSGKTTMASKSGGSIVKSFNDLAGFDSYILDRATMSMPKDEIVSENLKKIFRKSGESGALDLLVGSRNTIKSLREKRLQEGDSLIPDRKQLSSGSGGVSSFVKGARGFASEYPGASVSRIFKDKSEYKTKKILSGGFVPNFASPKLIEAINKRIKNPNVSQKLKEGIGLNDSAYMKAASKLGIDVAGLEAFLPQMGFPLRGKDKVLNLSKAIGFGFGRSFAIDALKMGDWNYVKPQFESAGFAKDDFDKLSKYVKTPKGESALKWWRSPVSKASGFVPNFASPKKSGKTFNSYMSKASADSIRFVHPLSPQVDAKGNISFPGLPKKGANATVIHREAMFGQDKLSLDEFYAIAEKRKKDPRFWGRNSFEYVYNSGGFVPNFADALNNAIAREKAAGLSSSQIYVDKHSSLKNKNNPMGLMVANTRDEPRGGIQGIKRAKKEGKNPKAYSGGASSGFVPNFALNDPGVFSSLVRQAAGAGGSTKGESDNAQNVVEKAIKKFPELGSEFEKVSKEFEGLSSDIDAWIKKIKELGDSASKSKSPAGDKGAESKQLLLNDTKQITFSKAGSSYEENKDTDAREKRAEAANKLKRAAEGEGSYQTFAMGGPSPYDKERRRAELIAARKKGVNLLGSEAPSSFSKSLIGRGVQYTKQNSMGIGFGLQAAAGMAGEYAGNDDTQTGRGVKAAASGLGDIASFAGTGAMIAGPWGALVGGIIGAGKGIDNFIKVWNSKTPDLEKALQISSDSMNRFGESGQKILQLNEQYMDALTSGGDPAKAADIMNKTQQAYAEELSKLTETQRSAMISAIAQGKGQEAYAKVLEELQQNIKADEASVSLQKYQESGGRFSDPNKKLIEGLDKTLAQDLTRGMDPSKIQSALDATSSSLNDFTVGTENKALALMKSLAANASPDQKANFEQVIKSFESAAANTDLSGVAEAFIKAIQDKPVAAKSAEEAAAAVKANTENLIKKQKEEVAIREATNSRLLKIQAETDSIYQKFNDGIKNFIGSMETSAKMRENVGEFKSSYLSESGANKNIVDKQSEKNLIQSSNDQLQIGKYKTQFDTMQSFQSGVKEMLSSLTIDSAKANLGETPTDQGNQLAEIRLSMQQALLPIEKLIGSGDYEKAGSETERILKDLPADMKAAVGEDAIVKGIQNLKSVTEDGNRAQKDLVSNSRRDLAIQAQQLVFQKALGKLNQAQNYGGAPMKDVINNSPDAPFNQAMLALGKLKATGYSQESLQQGKTNAVKGAWKGKEKETWGVDGKKPTKGMTTGLIDFYKAASQIGGESVLSTESKDFGLLTQEVSEALRSQLEQLKIAGAGQVDPAVFTRLESNLQGLGGEDKVAKLKIMKELGFANISGKKIMDEALGGYSGGAFEGLDPKLKEAFKATSDEGTGASLLLIAGQQKQTDSLSQGLDSVSAVGIETNKLLSIQPDAIAQAIGAVLEKSRSQENYEKEDAKFNEIAIKREAGITESKKLQGKIATQEGELATAKESLINRPLSIKKSDLEENSDKVKAARTLLGQDEKDAYVKERAGGISSQAVFPSDYEKKYGKKGTFEERSKEYYSRQYDEGDRDQKYNDARSLLKALEDKKRVEELEISIKDSKSKLGGIKEQDKTLLAEQEAQRLKVGDSRKTLDRATVTANQKNPLNYDRAPQTELEARQKARLDRENMYRNLSTDGPTERQLEARKISSGQKYKDIESKAIVDAGAQESQKGNIGKDKYEQRRMKAFELIDKGNALPDFKRFEDVYTKLAGDKESAKELYNQKKADKFGISPELKNQKPASVSSKSDGMSLDPNQIATAIKNMAAKGSDPKLIKDVISNSVSAGVDPGALASSLGVDPKNLGESSAIPVDAVNETNKILSAQPDAIASALASVLGVGKNGEQAPSSAPAQSDSPQTEAQSNAKQALLSAIASAREQSATQARPEGFVDWAKKQGKVSQDFSLTSEQKTGQVELPPEIKKLRDEFLSQKGIETGYGKVVSSGPLKSKSEYEYDKMESDYVESLKPKLTGRNPKTGQPMAANMREQTQLQEYSTAKSNLFNKKNYESSVEQQKREKNVEQQSAVQQEDSQALNSILGAVNQILQSVSESSGEVTNTQIKTGETSTSNSSNSSSNVNITNPINISVGNETGSAAAQEIGNQVSQLVAQVMTQLEPQIRKIASEVATNVSNKVAGNKPPPTQGMFA